jgi:hypothetical protein
MEAGKSLGKSEESGEAGEESRQESPGKSSVEQTEEAAGKANAKATDKPAKKRSENALSRDKGILGNRRLLRGGVVALAVLVALIAWLATRDGGDDSSAPVETTGPRIVSEAELADAAATSDSPIYWAGPVPGTKLELSELESGGFFVRYLPEAAEPGEGSAGHLTVGSYPLADPARALESFAGRPGSTSRQASDGREVVTSKEQPTSVYFASPDNSVQIEVYDPSPQRAMSLALSGLVQPAG